MKVVCALLILVLVVCHAHAGRPRPKRTNTVVGKQGHHHGRRGHCDTADVEVLNLSRFFGAAVLNSRRFAHSADPD